MVKTMKNKQVIDLRNLNLDARLQLIEVLFGKPINVDIVMRKGFATINAVRDLKLTGLRIEEEQEEEEGDDYSEDYNTGNPYSKNIMKRLNLDRSINLKNYIR